MYVERKKTGWVGLYDYGQMSACGTWAFRECPPGGLSKGSLNVFTHVPEKTTENSGCLIRQARSEIEPDTSRLLVYSAEQLSYRRKTEKQSYLMSTRNTPSYQGSKTWSSSVKLEDRKRRYYFYFNLLPHSIRRSQDSPINGTPRRHETNALMKSKNINQFCECISQIYTYNDPKNCK